MKRTAIITGASSGFGLLTAIKLAEQGFEVIATMRNPNKSTVFQTLIKDKQILNHIHPFPLEVTDMTSLEGLKKKVESLERVDVLVNNAGFAVGGFAEEVNLEAYHRQFNTNVFGVMSVTQAILPKMRKQGAGTIINISSISGKIAFPGLSPYVASKHALEGYTESLRLEVKSFGIQVALVEPGSFRTNIWSSGMEVADKSLSEHSPYHSYMKSIVSVMEAGKKAHEDPEKVAALVCHLAGKKKLRKLRYPIGKGVKIQFVLKKILPWGLWENIVFRILKQK